jgi:hypothetical protein
MTTEGSATNQQANSPDDGGRAAFETEVNVISTAGDGGEGDKSENLPCYQTQGTSIATTLVFGLIVGLVVALSVPKETVTAGATGGLDCQIPATWTARCDADTQAALDDQWANSCPLDKQAADQFNIVAHNPSGDGETYLNPGGETGGDQYVNIDDDCVIVMGMEADHRIADVHNRGPGGFIGEDVIVGIGGADATDDILLVGASDLDLTFHDHLQGDRCKDSNGEQIAGLDCTESGFVGYTVLKADKTDTEDIQAINFVDYPNVVAGLENEGQPVLFMPHGLYWQPKEDLGWTASGSDTTRGRLFVLNHGLTLGGSSILMFELELTDDKLEAANDNVPVNLHYIRSIADPNRGCCHCDWQGNGVMNDVIAVGSNTIFISRYKNTAFQDPTQSSGMSEHDETRPDHADRHHNEHALENFMNSNVQVGKIMKCTWDDGDVNEQSSCELHDVGNTRTPNGIQIEGTDKAVDGKRWVLVDDIFNNGVASYLYDDADGSLTYQEHIGGWTADNAAWNRQEKTFDIATFSDLGPYFRGEDYVPSGLTKAKWNEATGKYSIHDAAPGCPECIFTMDTRFSGTSSVQSWTPTGATSKQVVFGNVFYNTGIMICDQVKGTSLGP